jgi:tetratricopeptide (TPR) repeat protein
VVDFSSPLPWLALLIHAALLFFAFFRFRQQPIFSFAILFFLVMMSPVNNFFINNTTTLGERLMFVPSLGICIALVFLCRKFLDSKSANLSAIPGRKFINGSLLVIALFSGLTLVRSADWKNNMTLFQSGVDVCPNSSRTQYSLASECFKQMNKANNPTLRQEMAKKAGEHFQKSLEIMPENFQALYNYGLYNSAIGDTAKAIECYERVIQLDSTYFTAMNNLGVIYGARLDFKNAFRCYRMAYALNPSSITAGNLANLYFNQGIYFSLNNLTDSSMSSYRNSIAYDPKYIMAYNNMAVIFANRMQYDSCIYYLKKGYAFDTANLMILENIGAMSYLNKQYDQAIEFASKALALNPQLPKSRNTLVNSYTAKGDKAAADKYR